MLTVWCVKVGDKYTDQDVYRLQDMVDRNMNQRFWFRCITDRKIPWIDCVIPDRIAEFPGWWAKLFLFDTARDGENLYIDLDSVITGNLDRLVSRVFSCPANWGESGHGGCQSSVMSWSYDYSKLFRAFDPLELAPKRHDDYGRFRGMHGDQCLITEIMGDPGGYNIVPMKHIYSYKYHCRTNGFPPRDASVICFHGDPKPDQVGEEWIKSARQYIAIHA